MRLNKKLVLTSTALLATTTFTAVAQANPEAFIKDGRVFGEVRYRYENVDQEGFANEANAQTIRTNLGFETGSYNGFKGLIEGQLVQHVGDEDFNSTTNGQTTFPVVADPSGAELNQLWLSYSGVPDSVFKIGRQKINIDNQRFIGTVGWRQNDQTFDSLQITNTSIDNLDLQYAYISNVNRIFGDDNPLGDLDSNSHIARASYKATDWLTLTGYGYWLDFDELAARSSRTYGLRATGKAPLSEDWTFGYEAEYATQADHANNTASYDEDYYHITPSISGHGFTLKAGYEVLGGDGTNTFQTPLATLHKFNGWADAFLNTPDAGLEDAYISASYKFSDTSEWLNGVKVKAVYHNFDSDQSVAGDFGDEIDLSIGKTFTLPDAGQPFKKVGVTLKYADYNGENSAGTDISRQKLWLQAGLKF